jgi:transposase InsO family protein
LAGVARSWVYEAHAEEAVDALDLRLLELIDAQYTARPFYGSRRMVLYLKEQGHTVNRKHVQRLMRVLGLAGMAPGPATSKPHPEHKIYPYLLRGLAIRRPNQVWSTDITYIRLEHGFARYRHWSGERGPVVPVGVGACLLPLWRRGDTPEPAKATCRAHPTRRQAIYGPPRETRGNRSLAEGEDADI